MDARGQDTQLVAVAYSIEAILNRKREELVALVERSSLDPAAITVFKLSRQANGRYQIDPTDLPVINAAKSVINLLYTLQHLVPILFKPAVDYYLAEGRGIPQVAGLTINVGVNYLVGNHSEKYDFFCRSRKTSCCDRRCGRTKD